MEGLHLHVLCYQACSKSPVACSMYILEKKYEIHINTTPKEFLFQQISIELTHKTSPQYSLLPQEQKKNTTKCLNQLFIYGITTITQIQNPIIQHILSPHEFKEKLKAIPKLIKYTLHQVNILFPPQAHPPTTLPPQVQEQNVHTIYDNQRDPTMGKQIQAIINTKITTYKDTWGAQIVKKILPMPMEHNTACHHYMAKESQLFQIDHIGMDHNLFLLNKYGTKQLHKTNGSNL